VPPLARGILAVVRVVILFSSSWDETSSKKILCEHGFCRAPQ
jgi:hypothetical protein